MVNKRFERYKEKKTFKLTVELPKPYQKKTNYLRSRMKVTSKDKMIREIIDEKMAGM